MNHPLLQLPAICAEAHIPGAGYRIATSALAFRAE